MDDKFLEPIYLYYTRNRSIKSMMIIQLEILDLPETMRTLESSERKELTRGIVEKLKTIYSPKDIIMCNNMNVLTIVCPLESHEFQEQVERKVRETINKVKGTYLIKETEKLMTLRKPKIGVVTYPSSCMSYVSMKDNLLKARMKARRALQTDIVYYDTIENHNQDIIKYQEILRGIKNKEFKMYFQPQMDIETNEIIGYESLVRWIKDGEVIPPNDFIPFVEENDLIYKLGDYILNEAMQNYSKLPPKSVLSINISAKQFKDKNLLSTIRRKTKKYSLDPSNINIEITETVSMEDVDQTIALLDVLRKEGYKVSIDDFGVGYSSLSYIGNLPITHIKIDKTFIDKYINEDIKNPSTVLIETVVQLAKGLGLKAVIEGVETKEQLDYLRSIGCNEVQGYLISKPIPIEDIEVFKCRHSKEYKIKT